MDERIETLQDEISDLRRQLEDKEAELLKLKSEVHKSKETNPWTKLTTNEITRYSRQILVPGIGPYGQDKLKNARILIVGMGGLGCPASLYLASGGVGHLSIVDYDVVEESNLHRQILYSELDIGQPKVEAAYKRLKRINNSVNISTYHAQVDSKWVKNLLDNHKFDVVLDCTDNVATRYLINDACVMYKIPLVSGSALQMEGQLSVYNYKGSVCFRCLHPQPPPPETVTSCGDGGVLGPVPGTIGVLQAIEAIKILTDQENGGRMLVFDARDSTFRNVRLRPRNLNCCACGDNPTITLLMDYEQFCGAKAHDKVINIDILQEEQKIQPRHFWDSFVAGQDSEILVDVRSPIEFEMCSLPNSVNIPYDEIKRGTCIDKLLELIYQRNPKDGKVYFLCRRGNDSQRAIEALKKPLDGLCKLVNISGGLHSFARQVDPTFPIY